jgi:hypothetical protein
MFFMSANSSLYSDKEPFAEIHQSWMFLNIVRRVTSLKLNYKVEWLIVPILVASIRIWIWLFDTSVLNTIANTMIFSPWNCYDLWKWTINNIQSMELLWFYSGYSRHNQQVQFS